ncbi:MAG: response regulator [Chromatiales bacterium]|jgi:two-component system invasion response regulator UvrY|nr:response regulator [Chromatiales bacterium]
MKQRIGVVVCDTHQLSRNGLIRLLAEEEDIDLLAECDRGEDAIRLVREHRADVLVIDMEIPDLGGLEVARRLRRTDGSSQVILVGMHAEGPIPARALESGASGYLTRGCAPVEVVKAVRRAAEGRRYVDAEVAQSMVIDRLNPGQSPIATLTARELTVMVMVCNGYDRQTISERLCLSPKTVSTYRTRIMRKLGTANDVELTHLSYRHGLLELLETD